MTTELKLGAHFPWGSDLASVVEFSQQAERAGLDSVWLTDKFTTHGELWTTAALLATSTGRIRIGLDATDPYRRNIVVTAHSAATVDEISGGRLTLGIGRGTMDLFHAMGIKPARPAIAVREAIDVLRRLLAGERVTYAGEWIRLEGAQLTIRPVQQPMPIFQTASAPELVDLAIEIADGLLIWSGGLDYLRSIRDRAEKSRPSTRSGGRPFAIAPWIPFSVADDAGVARQALRPRMTEVIRRVPPVMLKVMGIDDGLVAPLRQAWAQGEFVRAESLLSDEVLDCWAVYGTPDQCAEKLCSMAAAGVTHAMLQFTDRWEEELSLFRRAIMPQLAQ